MINHNNYPHFPVYTENSLVCFKAYLVDVVTRYDVVEHIVEVVEQSDDLYRSTLRRQLCKSDNIREVDCGARKHLRRNTATSFQLVRHVAVIQRTLQDNHGTGSSHRCK